jgi:hypothetical protein
LGLLISLTLLCCIIACGNGADTGTGTGSNTTTTSPGSITLSMTKVSDGTYTDTLSTDSPTHLTAIATDGNGAPELGAPVLYRTTMTSDATQDPSTLVCTNSVTSGYLKVIVTSSPSGVKSYGDISVTD